MCAEREWEPLANGGKEKKDSYEQKIEMSQHDSTH